MSAEHSNIVERWENHEEAVVVKPKPTKRHWCLRYTLNSILALILLFPLFWGGKHDEAVLLVQLLIFGFALVLSGVFLVRGKKFYQSTGLCCPDKRILVLMGLLCGVIVVQLLPLSLSLVGLVSSNTEELYRLTGASFAYLSLEPSTTTSQLCWLVALMLVGFWLTSLPYETIRISLSSSKRKGFKSDNPILTKARETDFVVDLLQRAIVAAGMLCSVIAISHWALRSETLFGIFDPGRGGEHMRAHWPFINPDNLSMMLEVAIILAFSRLLRFSQLRFLKGRRSESTNLALRLLQSPGRLGRQVPYAIGLLTMILCNILTLSRGGNVLVTLGIVALWIAFSALPVKPRIAPVRRKQDKARRSLFHNRGFRFVQKIAALAGVIVVILFFLGQTGRDIATRRIEYGLAEGYDQSRQIMNSVSVDVISTYPVFGVGLGCWHLAAEKFIPTELAGWQLDYAHNDYLQLASEVGLVGSAIVVCALLLLLYSSLRAWQTELMPSQRIELIGSAIAILLPLIHAFFDFPFHLPALALILTIAIAIHWRLVQRALLGKDLEA